MRVEDALVSRQNGQVRGQEVCAGSKERQLRCLATHTSIGHVNRFPEFIGQWALLMLTDADAGARGRTRLAEHPQSIRSGLEYTSSTFPSAHTHPEPGSKI